MPEILSRYVCQKNKNIFEPDYSTKEGSSDPDDSELVTRS